MNKLKVNFKTSKLELKRKFNELIEKVKENNAHNSKIWKGDFIGNETAFSPEMKSGDIILNSDDSIFIINIIEFTNNRLSKLFVLGITDGATEIVEYSFTSLTGQWLYSAMKNTILYKHELTVFDGDGVISFIDNNPNDINLSQFDSIRTRLRDAIIILEVNLVDVVQGYTLVGCSFFETQNGFRLCGTSVFSNPTSLGFVDFYSNQSLSEQFGNMGFYTYVL